MKFERLGNICVVRNGYAFKSISFNKVGVPIIRISDINNNLVNVSKAVRIKYNHTFENFKIAKGEILIAMSGATTGKFGIYISDEIAYQNQRVGCFKILNLELLSYPYLLQALKILKPQIEKNAYGGGQPNISAKNIEDLKIPLPSLSAQLHIANILTKAENLIFQRKESVRLLDDFLKSTFLEMFGEIRLNNKKFPITQIEGKLDLITYGLTIRPEYIEVGIPLISAREIRSGYINYENAPKISQLSFKLLSDKAKPKKNDILFSKTGSIGHCALVNTNQVIAITQNAARLTFTNDINPVYALYYLRTPYFQYLANKTAKGNAVRDLQLGDFKKFNFIIPPMAQQKQFAQIVEKTEALKTQYHQSLRELENLYGSLSQKAFKGVLSLKDEKLMMAAEPEMGYNQNNP